MSSKDILSEGELDALMESVSADAVPVDGSGPQPSYTAFDFSTREHTLLAQMPGLHILVEKQSLSLAQDINALYKISAQVEPGEIQLIKLVQAMADIAEPAGVNVVTTAPLNGVSFVVLPADLLSFFVDKFFGGPAGGTGIKSSRKSITPTERRINDVLTQSFLTTLKAAWSEKVTLIPELVSFETNSDVIQGSAPDVLALLFSFAVKVGDWQSSIDWIVPYAALEPLRQKLGSPANEVKKQRSYTNWEAHFRRELQHIELELSGLFTSRRMSIAEVLKLRPGSIVPLKMPTEVNVFIDNQPFSTGEHGVSNGNKSIKIKELMENDADFL